MLFAWDEAKNRSNVFKHGISFDQAILVFDGPVWTRLYARFDYGEVRKVSVGVAHGQAIATVVHTDRNGVTRIISARLASRAERIQYAKEIRSANDF